MAWHSANMELGRMSYSDPTFGRYLEEFDCAAGLARLARSYTRAQAPAVRLRLCTILANVSTGADSGSETAVFTSPCILNSTEK